MKVKPFRIPRKIELLGLVIRVRVVDPGEDPEDSHDEMPSRGGDWDYNPITGDAVIRIASDLTIEEQRYTILHELQHMMVDYLHVGLRYYPNLVRVV